MFHQCTAFYSIIKVMDNSETAEIINFSTAREKILYLEVVALFFYDVILLKHL